MSPITTFHEYQALALALRTAGEGVTEYHMTHAIMGLSSEVGELASDIKSSLFYGTAMNKENMKKEIGDILWYLSLAAYAVGTTLEEVATLNIDKLKKRYPDGVFTTKDALERKDEK